MVVNDVYEMTLSKESFEEKAARGEDWMTNDIIKRPSFRKGSHQNEKFHANRSEQSHYITELLQTVEATDKTFSLFVITNIRETVQMQLAYSEFEKVVRELRDVYFIYADSYHLKLKGFRRQQGCACDEDYTKCECQNAQCRCPTARYAYGRLNFKLFRVKVTGKETYSDPLMYSLRQDAPIEEQPKPLRLATDEASDDRPVVGPGEVR